MRRGVNSVVPFTMKLVLFEVHLSNLFVCHLSTRRVFPTIQSAGHLKPFGSCRARDEIHDRLIIAKRLAAPIRRDERRTTGVPPCSICWCQEESDKRKSKGPFHLPTSAVPISRVATVSPCCPRHLP